MRLGRIQNDYSASGFDKVVSEGLEFIEICCNSHDDAEALSDSIGSVKEQILRTGIPVSCIGRWNHSVAQGGVLIPERVAGYERLLDTAMELGARTFVCGMNRDPSVSLYKNYTLAVKFLGELTERARGSGVKVAVQNCGWNNFLTSPEHWEIVLGELPELYIKFDASHAYNRGEDYLAQLSDWGERVAHVHVKGTTHAGKRPVSDPPAGMDDIRWRSLFSVLYSVRYDGDLSIEPHSEVWRGERSGAGIAFTRDFIRGFLV